MKRITTIFLFASLLAALGTVSYAGDRKPDTPIPKIEKKQIFEKSFSGPVIIQEISQTTLESAPDVGDYPKFDEALCKVQLQAEKSAFEFSNYRPTKPDPHYQGYRPRSILTRFRYIARPPNVIPLE